MEVLQLAETQGKYKKSISADLKEGEIKKKSASFWVTSA